MRRVWEGCFGSLFVIGVLVWLNLLDWDGVVRGNLVENWRV